MDANTPGLFPAQGPVCAPKKVAKGILKWMLDLYLAAKGSGIQNGQNTFSLLRVEHSISENAYQVIPREHHTCAMCKTVFTWVT